MDISQLSGLSSIQGGQAITQTSRKNAVSDSGSIFENMLRDLSEKENTSNSLIERLAAGEDVAIHDVMIASEETSVGFSVAIAIRDKLLDSYRQIMRMQV